MASLGRVFDANTVAPREDMEALPAGKYHGNIIASEWKDNKAGTGRYLEFQLDVLSGPFTGRKAWDRLNLDNPSAQAVEIAERTLSAICHATGQMNVTDTDQLHFKPFLFTMGLQKGTTTGQTEVKGYAKYEGQTPAAPSANSTPATRPAGNGYSVARTAAPAAQPAKPAYVQRPAYGQPAAAPAAQPNPMPPPAAAAAPGNGPWARA